MADPNAIVSATYQPECFDVPSMEVAREVILTPEDDLTSDERWERETPYLLRLIDKLVDIGPASTVLDYGCGVGRLAKALIDRHGCWVIGVDISANMRALAAHYVASPRFLACSPAMLDQLSVKADVALAVWVLQHCYLPREDIYRIRRTLKHGGSLFLVNENGRVVPTEVGWVNDQVDMRALLAEKFRLTHDGKLDPEIVSQTVTDRTFCAVYRKD